VEFHINLKNSSLPLLSGHQSAHFGQVDFGGPGRFCFASPSSIFLNYHKDEFHLFLSHQNSVRTVDSLIDNFLMSFDDWLIFMDG
jgi:hypothetical protein